MSTVISIPHAHLGLIVSLKPCLNLCSLRFLNQSLNPFVYTIWRKNVSLRDFVLVGSGLMIKPEDDLSK